MMDGNDPFRNVIRMRDDLGVDDYDRPPDSAYRPALGGPVSSASRVSQLAQAMRSLDQIEPALQSSYLLKGWLGRGASSVWYGESNVGKTFLALDVSFHIAARRNWHGNRVADAGAVVYVAGEGGAGIRNRIEALRRNRPDLIEGADFTLLPVTLDLCTSEDADCLAEALVALGRPIGLIVIDTLARAMGGGDENAAKDMNAFVGSIDHLRAVTGAHVMVIHHSGKDNSKGSRGHSSLRGAVDTEIELTREGQIVTAEARKQRDMPLGGVFAYQLESVTLGLDEDGDPVTSAVVAPVDNPPPRAPKITGQAKIALQAFGDALAHHGEHLHSDIYPQDRQCVSLEWWREYCDRHALSGGETATARRTAFHKAKTALQEKGLIRIVDDYAWRVLE